MRTRTDANPLPGRAGGPPWPSRLFGSPSTPPPTAAASGPSATHPRRPFLTLLGKGFLAGLVVTLVGHLGLGALGKGPPARAAPPATAPAPGLTDRLRTLAETVERTADPVQAARYRILLDIRGGRP